MSKARKYYWVCYDLDGSFDIFMETTGKSAPDSYGHLLGPFRTFAEAKRETIAALSFCISELRGAKEEVKRLKIAGVR
jgi:hypothetical protein